MSWLLRHATKPSGRTSPVLQLSDLTLSHYFEPIAPLVILPGGNHQLSNLPCIPESFRRGPDKLAESAGKMTLACKTSPQRDVRNPEICF